LFGINITIYLHRYSRYAINYLKINHLDCRGTRLYLWLIRVLESRLVWHNFDYWFFLLLHPGQSFRFTICIRFYIECNYNSGIRFDGSCIWECTVNGIQNYTYLVRIETDSSRSNTRGV